MSSTEGSPERSRSRTCFVIMPFSKSATCSEAEWTRVFEELIKPSVEAAGYDCRRSTATRGNLIKGIIQDLDASWVVLADLTDRNPNVFYELGVRHALKNRTILVAQKRDDIPFDLLWYANHIYDWHTPEGKATFAKQIKALLSDVDSDPNRADNPVSDFLQSPVLREQSAPAVDQMDDFESRLDALEERLPLLVPQGTVPPTSNSALKALGQGSPFDQGEPGVSWFEVGVEIATAQNSRALRSIVRRTKHDAQTYIPSKVQQLKSLLLPGSIKRNKIQGEALKFEVEFAPLTRNTELLALGLASEDWRPGARGILQIVGSLISAGEGISGLRFATGLPAFFGWRLLLMAGARSLQEESFAVTAALINSPLPVVRLGGQSTFQSLVRHRDLFYPEALLGYADIGISQVGSLYERSEHVHIAFESKDEFLTSLIEFLVLVALRDASTDEPPLYPGYRLLPGFRNACAHLVSRLVADPSELTAIAAVLNLTGEELRSKWSDLASKANAVSLGSDYWVNDNQIPTTLEGVA